MDSRSQGNRSLTVAALIGAARVRRCERMRYAGETACATNGKSFAWIGGACFSLPTPACGRIFSQLPREGLPSLYLTCAKAFSIAALVAASASAGAILRTASLQGWAG